MKYNKNSKYGSNCKNKVKKRTKGCGYGYKHGIRRELFRKVKGQGRKLVMTLVLKVSDLELVSYYIGIILIA